MNFNQNLTRYLLTANNPTMKDIFDRAIQYACDQGKIIYFIENKNLKGLTGRSCVCKVV